MLDATTMGVLAVGHAVALLLAIVATVKEAKGKHRSIVMAGYLYVAFISFLTVLAYVPFALHLSLPDGLVDTVMRVRYIAILFFLLGIFELASKKGNRLGG